MCPEDFWALVDAGLWLKGHVGRKVLSTPTEHTGDIESHPAICWTSLFYPKDLTWDRQIKEKETPCKKKKELKEHSLKSQFFMWSKSISLGGFDEGSFQEKIWKESLSIPSELWLNPSAGKGQRTGFPSLFSPGFPKEAIPSFQEVQVWLSLLLPWLLWLSSSVTSGAMPNS